MTGQVSEEGKRLASLIFDVLQEENADDESALMALMCITASIIGQLGDTPYQIKRLAGNLEKLVKSYHEYQRELMQ